jgi:hypothetical protein
MKLISLLFTTLLFTSLSFAAPVKVGDTKVIFEPPAGFKPVSQDVIDIKWPNKQAPQYVVGNKLATTTVAYDLKLHNIPQDKLGEAQKAFTQLFGRMIPGIKWKRNELVKHSGQKWILLEFTSNAPGTDIHNILFLTGFQGKMLIFNFNSTKEDFPILEKSLRTSLKSIKLPKMESDVPVDK